MGDSSIGEDPCSVSVATADERNFEGLTDLSRRRPLVAMVTAAILGVALGGVLFTGVGRLGAFAAAGYVANGLWRREGRLGIEGISAGLSE